MRVLSEKYYNYTMPNDKEKVMYDFYVLNYLNYIVDQPSKNFRDLPDGLVDSIKDATNQLYPKLRQELLEAVLYAITAELRHTNLYSSSNYQRVIESDNPKWIKLYKLWSRYMNFHTSNEEVKKGLYYLYDVRKPKSLKRPPETEFDNSMDRNKSYKSSQYAIEKSGLSTRDFVEMTEYVFNTGHWGRSYGGAAWGNISNGWLKLHEADKINTSLPDSMNRGSKSKTSGTSNIPMSVAIDHIYDLQHNTDTVFNKLRSYYKEDGYTWIRKALDKRANSLNYHTLLNHASGTVKSMAIPTLYNKLGQTWEKEMMTDKPKHLSPTVDSGDDNTEMRNQGWNEPIDDQEEADVNMGFEVGDKVKIFGMSIKQELTIIKLDDGLATLSPGDIYEHVENLIMVDDQGWI